MKQDFSRKISIVVNRELEKWQVLNTVAHISANFGHYLEDKFNPGDYFISSDGIKIPRNTQYPIIILEADYKNVQEFASNSLEWDEVTPMYFIREMIETSNDLEIAAEVENKDFSDIEFLGVGIFGENRDIKHHTSTFKLWST
jgi:hypothetical protein